MSVCHGNRSRRISKTADRRKKVAVRRKEENEDRQARAVRRKPFLDPPGEYYAKWETDARLSGARCSYFSATNVPAPFGPRITEKSLSGIRLERGKLS